MASRLVPQFNVLLLGLPAKIWVTLTILAVLLLRFPVVTSNAIDAIDTAFSDVLRGFVP
jgi:flagellar biosynthesis protein FliR